LTEKVQKECKANVLGALWGDFQGNIYAFDKVNGDRITLSHGAYDFCPVLWLRSA
jgi:hypothetical protein